MFSRIRNHEKLVENGENPVAVARKLKDGTHEEDSDPTRNLTQKKEILPKKLEISDESVELEIGETVDGESVETEIKKRRPKNGTMDIQYDVSNVIDLHSYIDPKKKSNSKGTGKGKDKEAGKGTNRGTYNYCQFLFYFFRLNSYFSFFVLNSKAFQNSSFCLTHLS